MYAHGHHDIAVGRRVVRGAVDERDRRGAQGRGAVERVGQCHRRAGAPIDVEAPRRAARAVPEDADLVVSRDGSGPIPVASGVLRTVNTACTTVVLPDVFVTAAVRWCVPSLSAVVHQGARLGRGAAERGRRARSVSVRLGRCRRVDVVDVEPHLRHMGGRAEEDVRRPEQRRGLQRVCARASWRLAEPQLVARGGVGGGRRQAGRGRRESTTGRPSAARSAPCIPPPSPSCLDHAWPRITPPSTALSRRRFDCRRRFRMLRPRGHQPFRRNHTLPSPGAPNDIGVVLGLRCNASVGGVGGEAWSAHRHSAGKPVVVRQGD